MSDQPPPIKPSNVLDSILSDSGPMPTARLGIRALAFLMDFVLLTALATFIIWKIVMPQEHPGAFAEFNEWSQEIIAWFSEGGRQAGAEQPQWSDDLSEALIYARDLQLLIFWLYFAIGEAFFAGSSLGKRACRLRSISTATMGTMPIMAGVVRGGLKTLTLFLAFPIALLATLGALFFNKRRQMGHDLLSRTAVIDEKYLNMPTKPSS
ncbi:MULTISPECIES: RDD family protein [unclassified Lentimonas]|uniref:RDD family protein n=1 Tax=unclassified Lentimonas TaxID=2630993 RepID=UPI00132C8F94|nr:MULTISPECIES: RDD family protein [unclassified Lentimonas]CAA6678900.1 Unannotated [Lentimonas sp. CC4]CAA6684506.1 Unannotated [Lentimonas sp. CC6]CAA7077416.1 Unannotated [Lentimonas sp. CC4]CAA7171252.1 Unannotated [Lentimonas sp. CC21]CAA7183281.1 Unannotated [Lentimonas sp. CC8]